MDTYEDTFNQAPEEEVLIEETPVEELPPEETDATVTAEPSVEETKPVQSKKTKKGIQAGKWTLAVLVALLVAVGGCLITSVVCGIYWQKQMDTMGASFQERIDVLQEQIDKKPGATGTTDKPNDGRTPEQVFEKVNPAVVEIACEATVIENGRREEGIFTGSGFFISEDGYIITNYHIIEGATSTTVYTSDGKDYGATIVGADQDNDFALLKIEAQGMAHVEFGSSDELAIGEQVVAIGYPLTSGSPTLTVGYISAKNRMVTTDGRTISMLQTDAAINSGNSGGPLLNMNGQVIGITTAKSSGTSSSGATIEGVGYAIPIDDISGLIEDLKEYGYIKGAYLGVWVRDVSEDAQSFGLPAGVYVEEVMEDYCAQKAGIQAKDIITNLGGYDVKSMTDLTLALRKFKAGETITVTVYRNGTSVYLNVTLDAKPVETQTEEIPEEEFAPSEEEFWKWYDYLAPYFGG